MCFDSVISSAAGSSANADDPGRSRNLLSPQSTKLEGIFDRAHPIQNAARFDEDKLEAEAAIDLFMDPFKT